MPQVMSPICFAQDLEKRRHWRLLLQDPLTSEAGCMSFSWLSRYPTPAHKKEPST